MHVLLFLPKVASRKYKLLHDKDLFDLRNIYTQASDSQFAIIFKISQRKDSKFLCNTYQMPLNFRGKKITLRSSEPRIFPGKGAELDKVSIIYHLTISEEEWSQSHDSL